MVHHDDCHAVGFMGKKGRGVHEYCGVMDRVDIITGTFGKALGGASGGYTSARKEIVDMLRQRSRPYLFSNTLAPAICAASIKVLDMLSESTSLRDRLQENTLWRADFDVRSNDPCGDPCGCSVGAGNDRSRVLRLYSADIQPV